MADESKAIASVELHIDEGNVAQALSRAEALASRAAQGARSGGQQQGGRQQEPGGYSRPSEEGRWRRPGGQFASSKEAEEAERRFQQQQRSRPAQASSIAGFSEPAARGAATAAATTAATAAAEVVRKSATTMSRERRAGELGIPGYQQMSGAQLVHQIGQYSKLERVSQGQVNVKGLSTEEVQAKLAELATASAEAAQAVRDEAAASRQAATEEAQAAREETQARKQALAAAQKEVTRSEGALGGGGGRPPRGFLEQATEALTKGSGGYRRYGHIDDESLAGGAARSVPLSLATGGIFTAGFALQAGIADAVKSAIALDRQMATLKVTVDALGQGHQFPQMRDDLLGISSATGVAGGDVANLAQDFMGFYDNVSQATDATKDVAQWIEITGENAQQSAQEIMTVAQAYGMTAQAVTDMNLAISQQTGRTPAEISAATSAVAPEASLYGFSQQRMAGIVAATAKGSGLSGAAVGSGLDKIMEALPNQINNLRAQGVNFSNPADLSQDMVELATQMKNLPENNKIAVAGLVGGAKNVPILSALANNPEMLSKDYTGTGLTAKTAATVGDTTAESLKHLSTSFSAFTNQLENSGVGVALTDLANGASGVLRFLGDLSSGLGKLDSATGDLPSHILALGVAVVTATKLIGTFGGAKAAGSALGSEGEILAGGAAASKAGGLLPRLGRGAGKLLDKGLSAGRKILGRGGAAEAGGEAAGAEAGLVEAGTLAGTFGAPEALLAAGTGYAAYRGTTDVLDTVFGKPKGKVKPKGALADQATDFVNNFAQTHQQVLAELAKVGTPQQRKEIEDALKKGDNLDLMKIYNDAMTGGGVGQKVVANQRQQDAAKAIVAAGGTPAPQTSWFAGAPQVGQGDLKNVKIAGFADISSIQAGVAGGMVTFTQAMKLMSQVIQGDATDSVKALTDALQKQAYASQVAMTGIANATQTAVAIGGLAPQNVPGFTLQQAAAQQAAGKPLTPADLVTLGTTLATQVSAANDALIQTTKATGSGAGFGGNLLQLALSSGTPAPGVSAAWANKINATDIGEGQPAAFNVQGNAVNTVFSPTQNQQIAQQMVSRQQAYTAQQVAAAQARMQSTEQVAQIQSQGDQTVLSDLEQVAAAHPNVDYQAQILQAAAKVSADQLAQAQAVVQTAQSWGTYVQALQFQSPIAQAQTAMATANASAAALGTTIAQLQAQPYGNLGEPQRQVLQQYATAMSQTFQAVSSAAQADIQLIQSENLADPARSAVDTLNRLQTEAQQQFGSMAALAAQAKAGNQGAVALQTSINQQAYQVFQSQQQAAQALNQLQQAQIGTTGNTPAVAAKALQGAQQQLAAFKAKFPASANSSNPQYVQLQTAVQNAMNQALETTISYNENLISEQVANNQISIGQAIQRMKVLQQKAKAVGNFAEVEQIQTQIQQYINQGNQNASFNLPSNLNLPTLYEVRRTQGTPTGANYYGNTGTVNVSINISNQVDVQPAVNKLMQAVGGPPTTGLSLPL